MQWTKQLAEIQQQKTETIKKETEKLKVTISQLCEEFFFVKIIKTIDLSKEYLEMEK